MTDDRVLDIHDLRVSFTGPEGTVRGVDGVDLHLGPGENLALIGESGSGKSATMKAVMGLFDHDPDKSVTGSVWVDGQELATLSRRQRRQLHGPTIGMVFQDALSALNPVQTVGEQIAEMFRAHEGASRAEARERAIEVMRRVRIPSAEQRYRAYPHEFSGGMRQRVLIAIAVALRPKILIADEPTTALDVTVQAHVMRLLRDLQDELQMSTILVTHDLGVAASFAQRVAVMYAGRIVETGSIRNILQAPRHPYTRALVASIPRIDARGERLATIPGSPPDPGRLPSGCAFHPRCPLVQDRCHREEPALVVAGPGRRSACHLVEEVVA